MGLADSEREIVDPAQCRAMSTRPLFRQMLPALALLAPGLACAQSPAGASQAWLSGLLGGLALVLVLLALTHRWERRQLLVATACLCWAALLLPVGPAWQLPLQTLLAISLLVLLVRQAGLRHRGLYGLLLLPPLLGLAIGQVGPADWAWVAQRVQPQLLGGELLLMATVFLWRRWRSWLRQGLGSWTELARQIQHTVLPLLVAAAVGGLLLHADRPRSPPLSVALLLGALAAGLVLAHARRRSLSERRELELEALMHDRLAEQERQHQLLSDQRLEQVTERERKRIASDLHDDLGAKLLTIVHTSDNERISTLAREALEEMRLSVRGLTGRPVQLLDAIGDWRAEVVSRLAQSNIESEWVSLAEDVAHTLPARAYVQTTRIIREAISNVIKHSGATRCVVRCALLDGDFQLVIQDNGKGVPTEKEGRLDRGHGMASMKSRAKQMQGQCLVESGAGWGTLIRLNIPL